MAAHHDDMPSTSSTPDPASRSRTPEADSTTSGGVRPGIGPYGCHTCRRSDSRRSISRTGGFTASAPTGRPGGATAGMALALGPDPDRDLDRAAVEAELLTQPPLHEPAVARLEEARGEQDDVRWPDAGLGGEQDLGLATTAHRRRSRRDQAGQPGVEAAGRHPGLPPFQGLLQREDEPVHMP